MLRSVHEAEQKQGGRRRSVDGEQEKNQKEGDTANTGAATGGAFLVFECMCVCVCVCDVLYCSVELD